jgi:hypothetical protein
MTQENYCRVPLLIDNAGGRREVVLAEPSGEDNEFIIQNIPAFTYGLGLKDTIRLLNSESGSYEVIKRARQIVVRLYVDGSLDKPEIKSLIDDVVDLGGFFEVGKNTDQADGKSLLLMALSLNVGFGKIEELLKPFGGVGYQWEYGNVYDADGNPLNWW